MPLEFYDHSMNLLLIDCRYAGLWLEPKEVFSHGQLYVAMSRVGDRRKLFVLSRDGRTKNVVHQAVL